VDLALIGDQDVIVDPDAIVADGNASKKKPGGPIYSPVNTAASLRMIWAALVCSARKRLVPIEQDGCQASREGL
jgi:hypothetical protein